MRVASPSGTWLTSYCSPVVELDAAGSNLAVFASDIKETRHRRSCLSWNDSAVALQVAMSDSSLF